MPIALLSEIAKDCPKNTRLMGVDLGTKTIGLAVCDEGQSIATPVTTIFRKKFSEDMKVFARFVREYGVGGFVFGWPLNMDGSRGPGCDRVQSFIDEMRNYPQQLGMDQGADVWIALFDERLSTSAVHDMLDNDVHMSGTKRKQVVDKLAAQLILQGALDYIHNLA